MNVITINTTGVYEMYRYNVDIINFTENIAQQICEVLFKHNIQSIIIEGGAKTLQTFIDANLWDEARVFRGTFSFENGVKAPAFSGNLLEEQRILNDTLSIYLKHD
ncbi:MAG: hypothetical protein EOP00_26605 [Pedobacter sp.]|nr:MAG: hypothetical protein EOP00_26605 [Pedobacter sp.]